MASVRVPLFHPARSRFRFSNSEFYLVDIKLTTWQIPFQAGQYGLCGGMAWAARDLHDAGRLPGTSTVAPPLGSTLHDYIYDRLIESLDPATVTRYQTYSHPAKSEQDLAKIMINDEWPLIKADLDAGKLSPLGTIRVRSPWPQDVFKNHQVLAWGYDLDGSQLTLHIYDPNRPNQDCTLSLNISNPNVLPPITNVNAVSAIMFFRTPYFFKNPSGIGIPRPADDAVFESQQLPTGLTPGRTQSAFIVMTNVGTATWQPASTFLGAQNPVFNHTWGPDRIAVSAPVPPGTLHWFTIPVTGDPSLAGNFAFQWQMVRLTTFFGDRTPLVQLAVNRLPNEAFVKLQPTPPLSVQAGSTFQVTVTMLNAGNNSWFDEVYFLGVVLDVWGLDRVRLPHATSVNQTATFTFTATAPKVSGVYDFQWQMIDERINAGFFGDPTMKFQITVTGGLSKKPARTWSRLRQRLRRVSRFVEIVLSALGLGQERPRG